MRYPAQQGYLDIVKDILSYREGQETINIKDIAGQTPLYVAVRERRLDIVKEMLKYPEGLDAIAIQDNDGKVLLYLTVEKGDIDVIKQIKNTDQLSFLCTSLGNLKCVINSRESLSLSTTTISNKPPVLSGTVRNITIVHNSIRSREQDNTVNLILGVQ